MPPRPVVLGPGFGQPDDVVVAPGGIVYFSDFSGGRIGRLSLSGGNQPPVVVASGLAGPEGIVVLPDGSLVVAEQGRNRLVRVDPATGAVRALIDLTNRTGLEGVDGLAWDGPAAPVLVPDSPNGRLLLFDPATGHLRVLVGAGLGRPTGAWPLGGGAFAVVDETGGRVLHVAAARTAAATGTGARSGIGSGSSVPAVLARMSLPDDVVVAPNGAMFVNSLAGAVWEVAPTRHLILGGLKNPQGLALAPDGSLVVVETGRNRLLRIPAPLP